FIPVNRKSGTDKEEEISVLGHHTPNGNKTKLDKNVLAEGAAATVGEEMEQVNSTMSRHGGTSKHMTSAGRRDHLTTAMQFWNKTKDKRMAKMLVGRLRRAKILLPAYEEELRSLLTKMKLDESDVPNVYQNLIDMATGANAGARSSKNIKNDPVDFHKRCLEGLFVELMS
ncbi:Uncharacterized protein APZ42_005399, partial [Daphnia magna]